LRLCARIKKHRAEVLCPVDYAKEKYKISPK